MTDPTACPSIPGLGIAIALFAAVAANAQIGLASQFASGVSPVGCAFDPATATVWVYPSFGSVIHKYSSTGTPLGTIPRPGGAANDADLEVAPVAFTLGNTLVPAGSLLFIDGESGVAEIHALDPATGAVIGSLVTGFGASHVVGGAFHPLRGSFYLVQDRVPGTASLKNLVAEIDPVTGQVLASFQTTQGNPAFTVNYGDLEVTAYGNLLIVSSDEGEIGEFTAAGAWVRGHPLPAGVTSMCGIGLDASGCRIWVSSTGGAVFELSANCPTAVTYGSGCPSSGGSNTLTATSLPWVGSTFRATATGLPQLALAVAVTSLVPMTPPLPLSAVLPQGQPGCFLHVRPDVVDLLVVSAGSTSSQLVIPAIPAYVGAQFHQQIGVLELDGTLAIVSLTSTNALRMTVGSY